MSQDRNRLDRLIEEAEAAETTLKPPPAARPRRSRAAALTLALALSAAALLTGWSWQQRLLVPDESALEAGRRLGLSIAAEAIHDFTRRTGRYPATLEEAVPVALHISYRRLADGFELQAVAPNGRIISLKDR